MNGWMQRFASTPTVARTDVWPSRGLHRGKKLRRDPVKSRTPSESEHAHVPSSLFLRRHINAITPAPNQFSAPRPHWPFVCVQICQRMLHIVRSSGGAIHHLPHWYELCIKAADGEPVWSLNLVAQGLVRRKATSSPPPGQRLISP